MFEGLAFFHRTSSPKTWNIAAYHSPHSLTWRWVLSFSRGGYFGRLPRIWTYRDNNGRQWSLNLPWIGSFDWRVQRPMWFRDLYIRQRDKRDHERYVASMERSTSAPPAIAPEAGTTMH